jgi:hypothetical protein
MYLISPQFFLFSITSAKVRHYSFFAALGKGFKKLSFQPPFSSRKKRLFNRGREGILGCMLLPFLSKLDKGQQKNEHFFCPTTKAK